MGKTGFPKGCSCFCYFWICKPMLYLLLWYAPSDCFLKPLLSEMLLREDTLVYSHSVLKHGPVPWTWFPAFTNGDMKHGIKKLIWDEESTKDLSSPSKLYCFYLFLWFLMVGCIWFHRCVWGCGDGACRCRAQNNCMNYYSLENMYCTLIMLSKVSV